MSIIGRVQKVTIHIKWLPSGSFFLSAPAANMISPDELGRVLFTWDPRSFYGTLCRYGEWQGRKGILLGAFEALDFFVHDYANAAVRLVWPEELPALKNSAAEIVAALQEGRFLPDFATWQRGSLRWKLAINKPDAGTMDAADAGSADVADVADVADAADEGPQAPAGYAVAELEPVDVATADARPASASLLTADVRSTIEFFDDWVHHAITQQIAAAPSPSLKAAWESVLQGVPQLGAASSAIHRDLFDEEEWLISIGLRRDSTPFTVGIGLVEPEGGKSWRLEVVLQDRIEESRLFVYESSALEDLPAAWHDYLPVAEKAMARWIRLAPWLENDGPSGTVISELDEAEALTFLTETAPALTEAGSRVYLPDWWETARRMKARLKARVKSSVGATNQSLFGIQQIVQFDWAAAIGDVQLSPEEFAGLLAERRKLVQVRGRWVVLDAAFYDQALQKMKRIEKTGGLTLRDVLEMHLTGDAASGGRTRSDGDANKATGGLDSSELSDSSDLADGDLALARPLAVEVELNRELAALVAQLKDLSKLEMLPEPATFQGQLRPYQRVGYSWLTFLRRFGLGACLADDMGLGKTIQYIAYLLHGKESRRARPAELVEVRAAVESAAASRECVADQGGVVAGRDDEPHEPHEPSATSVADAAVDAALLVCPTSVIGNWERELRRFAPDLRVYVHYGSGRRHEDAFEDTVAEADLVLTTYGLANLDESDLTRVHWDSICLDEAQNIKNAYTKQTESIRKLRGRHFIAMTGTPVENRLTELWSIFDFLNPGYLGSLRTFRERFVNPIEKTRDAELIGVIQRLVQPFLLRREKRDPAIELDLPEKNESKLYVPLTAEQAALYEATLQKMLNDLDRLSLMERRGAILGTLTKLKQICDHPAVFLKERAGGNELDFDHVQHRSEKLARLVEMIGELRAEGDKCLIFTQFVETGRLLQDVLMHELGEEVLFLHGGVPKAKRDDMVSRFQQTDEDPASAIDSASGPSGRSDRSGPGNATASAAGRGSGAGPAVFILCLKAGGVGLNLTAANHVFHFDRWWNPAVENQATDRAYRIGQHRHVQVFKFVALGTLEERIDEMLESKQSLSQQVVGGGENWITELSTDDLRNLFMLRREWVEE